MRNKGCWKTRIVRATPGFNINFLGREKKTGVILSYQKLKSSSTKIAPVKPE
jgi:hypothetical protein